jgi:hypothetical protein
VVTDRSPIDRHPPPYFLILLVLFRGRLAVMTFVGGKGCGLVYIGQKGPDQDYDSSKVEGLQLRILDVSSSNLGTVTDYPV